VGTFGGEIGKYFGEMFVYYFMNNVRVPTKSDVLVSCVFCCIVYHVINTAMVARGQWVGTKSATSIKTIGNFVHSPFCLAKLLINNFRYHRLKKLKWQINKMATTSKGKLYSYHFDVF